VSHIDAKSGGAANPAARAIKLKMQPDEAMKILNIEKFELTPAIVEEVIPSITLSLHNLIFYVSF
jgi:hypothetical protein